LRASKKTKSTIDELPDTGILPSFFARQLIKSIHKSLVFESLRLEVESKLDWVVA